jgi:hypothetical protein
VVSRYRAMPLPDLFPDGSKTSVVPREGVFAYEPAPLGADDWHLNFAHEQLFCAYGGAAFAQDELQVAEHPSLASLRERLLALPLPGLLPLTREAGEPTPVLVRGAPRTCAIATDADADEGRPHGLYGRAFARASERAIRAAVSPLAALSPPTSTNLVCIEAPPGGVGAYTAAQLRDILVTAYTGFAAAVAESALARGPGAAPPRVRVHTGHWGTGAYGGDRVLMAMLQVLAARLACLDELVFFTFDDQGARDLAAGAALATRLGPGGASTEGALAGALAGCFRWGDSDGN